MMRTRQFCSSQKLVIIVRWSLCTMEFFQLGSIRVSGSLSRSCHCVRRTTMSLFLLLCVDVDLWGHLCPDSLIRLKPLVWLPHAVRPDLHPRPPYEYLYPSLPSSTRGSCANGDSLSLLELATCIWYARGRNGLYCRRS